MDISRLVILKELSLASYCPLRLDQITGRSDSNDDKNSKEENKIKNTFSKNWGIIYSKLK